MPKQNRAITSALKALEKRFGSPMVMKMGDAPLDVETISSGRDDLNILLGGGYAHGKIIEIYGEEATGKTGLALESIVGVQEDGGTVALIDSEHALNTEYCKLIGINIEELLISQPDTGEQAFEIMRALINTGEVDLIIIDSVTAMTPLKELEGESGQAHMAMQARMMSQGMKLVSGPASSAGCTLIFINQMRDTLSMYGPSKKPTGGNALKYYANQRIEVKNKGKLKTGDDVIGFKQEVHIVKNKIAPPFKKLMNDIVYGIGVDSLTGIIDACVFEEIIHKAGSWFSYNGTKLGQGMKVLRATLEDNPELVEELQEKLKQL